MALSAPGGAWREWTFERRDLRADDAAVRVLWCGVCHSDLHAVEGMSVETTPLVPGHEFVGEVTEVGAAVTELRPGGSI